MQDHGRRLRGNRKGVIDLPIKMMVTVILITISLPIISNALETSESDMMTAEAEQEVGKIMNGFASVHYSGIGSSVTVDVELPAGTELSIGGEGPDAFSMRTLWNGSVTSTRYFERPVIFIPDEILVCGHCTLILTSTYIDGSPSVEVSVV